MKTRKQATPTIDPVCGMSVDPATAAAKVCHEGVEIYFCAEGCKQAFVAHPQKYAAAGRRKGFWRRYLDRLNKATGGQPPACH